MEILKPHSVEVYAMVFLFLGGECGFGTSVYRGLGQATEGWEARISEPHLVLQDFETSVSGRLSHEVGAHMSFL